MTPEKLARKFHEAYERLAPKYGYETKKETRKFVPESKNGRLMIAVADEILTFLFSRYHAPIAQQAIAGPDDGLKPCPDDCHYRNGRLCVLGPTNHCIRRAEDYYKPGTASAIAER